MPVKDATLQRRFAVHGAAEAPSRAHMIEGASFEDAALHFVENFHPTANANDEVSLMVEACDTGERQCFRVHTDTGETAPCD
ncbi:hypothetical protein DJ021_00830 [Phenylobacterium hankyongense]|uniref:Uncharacterized protein n=1 Tax=Phenylobacterium hankyongense TaxID=1813876 RepID=A0A328ATL9_9CAUL|nr:DUF5961 family protein [Phenylobacterium hankyongense]RAK58443.1 hypothetical protein DJ021_00830 [Phenylobacterium hankyongense]